MKTKPNSLLPKNNLLPLIIWYTSQVTRSSMTYLLFRYFVILIVVSIVYYSMKKHLSNYSIFIQIKITK